MTDFRLVLKIVSAIFFACLMLSALLTGLDGLYKVPLADFLVRKLADIMILCVGAFAGLLAGNHIATKTKSSRRTKGR